MNNFTTQHNITTSIEEKSGNDQLISIDQSFLLHEKNQSKTLIDLIMVQKRDKTIYKNHFPLWNYWRKKYNAAFHSISYGYGNNGKPFSILYFNIVLISIATTTTTKIVWLKIIYVLCSKWAKFQVTQSTMVHSKNVQVLLLHMVHWYYMKYNWERGNISWKDLLPLLSHENLLIRENFISFMDQI